MKIIDIFLAKLGFARKEADRISNELLPDEEIEEILREELMENIDLVEKISYLLIKAGVNGSHIKPVEPNLAVAKDSSKVLEERIKATGFALDYLNLVMFRFIDHEIQNDTGTLCGADFARALFLFLRESYGFPDLDQPL